jgi:Zn-dependent peptidase ImmA (M78 family)
LGEALTVLNDRERRIFEARRLADDPITLEELADEFGVSRERVRQIEVRAFEKVQKTVRHRFAAMQTLETLAGSNSAPAPWMASTHIHDRRDAQRTAHTMPSSAGQEPRVSPFATVD